MIVFDLKCGTGHVFEAWFASSGAFEEQKARDQVRCPVCDRGDVVKAAMAPNVAPKGNRRPAASPETAAKAFVQALAAAQAEVLKSSTWVGGRFAEKARAMHLGEEAKAPIHGQATVADAKALVEEGIEVAALPMPVVPPEAVN